MKNKKMILAAIAFVLVVAIALTVYFVTKPKGNQNEKTFTVTVVHSDGKKWEKEITSSREFLADALIDEGLFTAEDIASGMTNVVDGETVDAAQEQWWYVKVNGENPGRGMKEVPLKENDHYTIEFTVGYDMLF